MSLHLLDKDGESQKPDIAQLLFGQALTAFEEQLDRAVIGGIHVEWWGVIFFIAGIILASASPELAGLLGHAESCE